MMVRENGWYDSLEEAKSKWAPYNILILNEVEERKMHEKFKSNDIK